MSTVRQLFSVNAVIGITLFFGFINNLGITAFFGLNSAVDAYFAAHLLPGLFMFLVVDYLGKNFLPIYAARRHESPEDADRLVSTVVFLVAVIAGLAAAALAFFAALLFDLILPGFDSGQIDLVSYMFQLMAPSIVLMAVGAILQYVWQHDEKFTRVARARMFVPITLTGFILVGRLFLDEFALPIGFLAGQCIMIFALLYRIPCRFTLRINLRDRDVKKIFTNSAALMGSGLIARSRGLIIQYFASTLGEGTISALAISSKVCQPIYQSALMGLRMIVFTRSAKEVARGDLKKLGEIHNFSVAAVLLWAIPISLFLAVNSGAVVDVLFQRGKFTPDMVEVVSLALIGHALAVPFLGINQILSNAFYAMGRIRIPMLLMPAGTIVYFFVLKYMSQNFGILGMALGYAAVAAITTSVMLIGLQVLVPSFSVAVTLRRAGTYALSAALVIAAGKWMWGLAGLDVLPGILISGVLLVAVVPLLLGLVREEVYLRVKNSLLREVRRSA